MSDIKNAEAITAYIRERFLDGDPKGELEADSPLLEWGVLNSLNTARLIGFIRDEIGVQISPMEVNAENFRDVRSITAMVSRVTPVPAS